MSEKTEAAETTETSSTIGTPLSSNATRVLLLGAGEIGRELAISFQRLGLEIHAVDKRNGAPGHQVAQYSYVADVTDAAAVLELAKRIEPDYVIPEVEIVAVEALREIEEASSAVVVPGARACELTMEREAIRRTASEQLGLPTTAYDFASSPEELKTILDEMGYPSIVKPAVTSNGRGHMVVRYGDDVTEAWQTASAEAHFDGRVIVERFVDFDFEVTLLAVRSIDPKTGELATWFAEPIGHDHRDGGLIDSWQPLQLSQVAMENARSIAARISNELGGRGVYGVELFVAGDDVYFSSVSPRPTDTGMVTMATQRYSQFDLHARAILGLPIDVTLTSPGAARMLCSEVDADTLSYGGLQDAFAHPETSVLLFGKAGSYPGRRMGVVLSTADNTDAAHLVAREASMEITIAADDDSVTAGAEGSGAGEAGAEDAGAGEAGAAGSGVGGGADTDAGGGTGTAQETSAAAATTPESRATADGAAAVESGSKTGSETAALTETASDSSPNSDSSR
ncbi:formate-dependent phosphoribosylglycinamide formyltransferase [Corynebacterium pseudodiphtheriticum]|uniref:formate-dependent phosphoribosylglycinamide formyltransferase n=1 Tax=Corynebacterium pseudodiphtheriticum TaxID=37637 RepID=UPI00254A8045|nr:formate-dependent phosphoribosylglycinamide formyltransferase [Corynebacterium pseudodiphtheriticum]MDK8576880.1 formate-dependent phosphoribosylglycinamide formyltransferase [Corynebacterium pseudodiphtheriticum]